MSGIINALTNDLTNIGLAIATLGLVALGLMLVFKFKKQEGLREAITGVGIIAIACIIIGGATAFADVFLNIGESLPGAK